MLCGVWTPCVQLFLSCLWLWWHGGTHVVLPVSMASYRKSEYALLACAVPIAVLEAHTMLAASRLPSQTAWHMDPSSVIGWATVRTAIRNWPAHTLAIISCMTDSSNWWSKLPSKTAQYSELLIGAWITNRSTQRSKPTLHTAHGLLWFTDISVNWVPDNPTW